MRPLFGWTDTGLLIALGLACFFDVRFRRIPNVLVGVVLCASVALILLGLGELTLSQCILGAVFGLLVPLPLYAMRALGAGDVKLMAAIGAFLGVPGILWVIVYTGMAGGAMGLAVLWWLDGWKQTVSKLALFIRFRQIEFLRPGSAGGNKPVRPVRLPYALAISAGVAVYRFFGPPV